jgi:FkbM family methyltransferase
MKASGHFVQEFLPVLLEAATSGRWPRWDNLRFQQGGYFGIRRHLSNAAVALAARFNFYRRRFSLENSRLQLEHIAEHLPELTAAYTALSDDASRALFVRLLVMRVVGSSHVALPIDTPAYWAEHRRVARAAKAASRGDRISVAGFSLRLFEVPGRDGPIHLYAHPLNLLNTFVLQQYAYQDAALPVFARPGDVVIDAGGCWGDTALYFADAVGAQGKVFCFEFANENLAVLEHNLELNAGLRSRIELVKLAVWSTSGTIPLGSGQGPGTRVGGAASNPQVACVALDDFVRRNRLKSVGFVKMDIEGAELEALYGARELLTRYSPALAVSAYHKPQDLFELPVLVKATRPDYRLHLGHCTTHGEETVLFAQRG